ncbi:Os05g0431001 [Oryza sativa Japonica Group]|uniref:Os05g0431001 protein n=1 Tax=Oryza sativa subsp. japonica TaxID=39947 RepID=C7J2K1_ORYSJ|nr:Os05g0431001 [Oryza sativa Japonica Group]|eukprot:NP_001174440.1 Os05g0431001 [Oryza sativa Japonica Group]
MRGRGCAAWRGRDGNDRAGGAVQGVSGSGARRRGRGGSGRAGGAGQSASGGGARRRGRGGSGRAGGVVQSASGGGARRRVGVRRGPVVRRRVGARCSEADGRRGGGDAAASLGGVMVERRLASAAPRPGGVGARAARGLGVGGHASMRGAASRRLMARRRAGWRGGGEVRRRLGAAVRRRRGMTCGGRRGADDGAIDSPSPNFSSFFLVYYFISQPTRRSDLAWSW